MLRRLSRVSFAHLKRSDLLLIKSSSNDPTFRQLIIKKLIAYLDQWKGAYAIDEETLFILGVQLSSVWPHELRNELFDALRSGVDNDVLAFVINGFEYASSFKSNVRVKTPTRAELDELLHQIEEGRLEDLRHNIDSIVERHKRALERYGSKDLFVRVIRDIGDSLLRNQDQISAARIAQSYVVRGIEVEHDDTYLWMLWARALATEGALDAAERALWEASRVRPDVPQIYCYLCRLISANKERLIEAIVLGRQTLERFAESQAVHVTLASVLRETGHEEDRDEAIELLTSTISRNTGDYRPVTLLGRILRDSHEDLSFGSPGLRRIVEKLPREPRTLGYLGQSIADAEPGSILAEGIFKTIMQRFPENKYAPNQLARVLLKRQDAKYSDEAISVLRTARRQWHDDVYTLNHLAESLSKTGKGDDMQEAVSILREAIDVGEFNEYTERLLEWLTGTTEGPMQEVAAEGELEATTFAGTDEQSTLETFERQPIEVSSRLPPDIARSGELRYIRFILESNFDEGKKIDAERRLREILAEEVVPSYARILAVRMGIWEGKDSDMPTFAVSFEAALKEGELETLNALSMIYPRLDALILIARALFGDDDAGELVQEAIARPERQLHPAVVSLKHLLEQQLKAVNAKTTVTIVLRSERERVIAALRDVSEMTIEREKLAA